MNLKVLTRLVACCCLLASCITGMDTKNPVNIAFRPVIGYDTRAEESVPFPEDRTFNVWAQKDRGGDLYLDNDNIAYKDGWNSPKIWLEEGLSFQAYWPLDIPVSYSKSEGIQIKGFDCTAGNVDILIAKAHSDANIDGVLVLPFDHILSRLEFRMMHSLADGMSVRLKKIELKGFGQNGDYNTASSGQWHVKDYSASHVVFESEEGAEVIKGEPLYFGEEFYTIPQICVASVEVSYEVKYADATWIPQVETIKNLEVVWESSKHYTYTLNLCMDKMKHTTGISSWRNRE